MKDFNTWLTAEKNLDEAAIKELSTEAQASHIAEYMSSVAMKVDEAVKSGVSKEELAELGKEQSKALAELGAKHEAILLSQGAAIKSAVDKLTKTETSTSKSILEQLKEKKDEISRYKNGESVKITLKAPVDMTFATNVTGQIPQAERLPGMNMEASREIKFLDVLQSGTISSNLVEWVYQSGKEGTAGQTVEAALKNQIDFDLLVGSQKVEKTTAYITITDEMLDDVEFMATEINNELNRELLKAVELGAYSGSGVSPQLNGVFNTATAFAAGTFALAVDNANEVDVLTVAANQIKIAEQGMPNYIFMNPSDVTALKMVKVSSTDKRYVERLAMVAGSLSLDGVPIVETTLVDAGQYLIGDFTKAHIRTKAGISIDVGYTGDNFIKNFKTIRAEWRGVVYVKNNDRTAFVKGDFLSDKAALETTP